MSFLKNEGEVSRIYMMMMIIRALSLEGCCRRVEKKITLVIICNYIYVIGMKQCMNKVIANFYTTASHI